jgi:hypothetical protein
MYIMSGRVFDDVVVSRRVCRDIFVGRRIPTEKESVLVSVGAVGKDKHSHSRQKNEESKGQSSYQLEDIMRNAVEYPGSSARIIRAAEHFDHSTV